MQELEALITLPRAALVAVGAAAVAFLWYRLRSHEKRCEERTLELKDSVEAARKESAEGDKRIESILDSQAAKLSRMSENLNQLIGRFQELPHRKE